MTAHKLNTRKERESKRRIVQTTDGFIKGSKTFHSTQGVNLKLKFNSTNTKCTLFDVIRKTDIARLDHPHIGHNYHHLNINPKVSGIRDPHIKLSPATANIGLKAAKLVQVVNKINKVVVPVAIAIDTVRTGCSVIKDHKNGTTRNTVGTVATIAGGWGFGLAGAEGGLMLGTMILPGLGTVIGGFVGAIVGGIVGTSGANYLVDAIGDNCDYDMAEKICKECKTQFKVRGYLGEQDVAYCENCIN